MSGPSPIVSPPALVRVDCDAVDVNSSALSSAWDLLVDDCTEPNCFMERWFVEASINNLKTDTKLKRLSVWQGDQLIGLVILEVAQKYGRLRVQHTINWQSTQGFYGAPLVRRGYEVRFWRAILDMLDTARWAVGFLSLSGLAEGGAVLWGLQTAIKERHRPSAIVHRKTRAFIQSSLDAEAYLAQSLRPKKRKELRRLVNRLREHGTVSYRAFAPDHDLNNWINTFLALEASGWKGSDGAAFANSAASTNFFREIVRDAHQIGVLDFIRLDIDGRAIAMLVNFLRPPGSFSFKIAYNEDFARFSPGVLIELENLQRVLTNSQLEWMDSCATENHPMINSLWMERRTIVQVTVALKGLRRGLTHRACRGLEIMAKYYRQWSAR